MKVIITGVTGMVGEGVLMVSLKNPSVKEVLVVGRNPSGRRHPKMKELILKDFATADTVAEQLKGYDACFFCAGVSSLGMNEQDYTKATFDVVVPFAKTLAANNPDMVFNYVSGASTDSSEKGKVMWARVKGHTENTLQKLPFKAQYNFRPGGMKPVEGQKNVPLVFGFLAALYPFWLAIAPNWVCTLDEVGIAMIHSVSKGYPKSVLEVPDIKELAK